MKYKLTELIDIDQIQVLTDNFCDAIGIASAIIDLKGKVLVKSRWQKICTDFHRVNPQTCHRCIESDTVLANKLLEGQKHAIYQCQNGLIDAATPIVIEGEHIANFFIGQFLFEPPDKKYFQRQAREYGFDETAYLKALSRVPIIPKDKIESTLSFFSGFAEFIGEMGLSLIRQLKADDALQVSEIKFRTLIEHLPAITYTAALDETSTILYVSPQIEEILGISPENYKANPDFWVDHLHYEDRERVLKEVSLAHKTGQPFISEYRMTSTNGRIVWIRDEAVIIKDDKGNPQNLQGVMFDITERKRAEEALRESEERLRVKLDYILSPENEIEDVALIDLIGIEDLQRIQDAFAAANDVASIISDVDGNPITKASNFCGVCEIIRSTEKGNRNCIKSDKILGEKSKELMKPTFEECRSCGFVDASAPIIIGGKHIANWLIGQSNVMGVDKNKIETYAKEIGADINEMLDAYEKMPEMSLAKFKEVLDLLWVMAKEISTLSHNNLKLAKDITERKRAEKSVRIYTMQQYETAKFGKLAMSDISIDELMDEAVIILSRVLNTKYSKVLEHLPNEKKLFLKAGVGWKKGWVGNLIMSDGEQSQGGYSLLCESPVISKDIFHEKRFSPPPLLTEHNVASGLTVVIPGKERPYGVLGVHTDKKRMFTSDDANFIQTFANVLADVIELKREKEALKQSEEKLRSILNGMSDYCYIVSKDYKIEFMNKAMIEKFGDQTGNTCYKAMFNRESPCTWGKLGEVQKGETVRWEHYFPNLEGTFEIIDSPLISKDGAIVKMGIWRDISDRKHAEEKIDRYMKELERSNKELEQFAYVASHDLQEPLRMVSSYTQLIEERYKDKLDKDANEFIDYAVDGANRMQILINDLLSFSRVTTRGKPFEPVDFNSALGHAIVNMQMSIEETSTIILNDKLPTVKADESQIIRVFQNLIDNAIKFRSEKSPKIYISAKQEKGECVFSVKDNGIGIEPEYKERIFQIFQRLHSRKEYPGTGMGLSICRRIVERHGGRMWLESESGKGSTFYFKIPN